MARSPRRAKAQTLSELVDKIAEKGRANNGISIADIRRLTGRRMAGPLLFFPAMVVVSPLSIVPTIPTTIAVIVLLVAGQLMVGIQKIWLPKRILKMSLSGDRLEKVMKFMAPAARWIDKVSKPRLSFLTQGLPVCVAAGICVIVALTMPPLEFFPGASTAAGVIIATFGLSITTQDGILMTVALILVAGFVTVLNWIFF